MDRKLCGRVLDLLLEDPRSELFRAPVTEAVAPGYFAVVKEPMDLSTVKAKMAAGEYDTTAAFVRDIRLIWSNCKAYNAPATVVYGICEAMEGFAEEAFRRTEIEGMPPVEEQRATMLKVLDYVRGDPRSVDFGYAIDTKALGYTGYDDVVKERMDLHTLEQNIKSGKYDQQRGLFVREMMLPFENAISFSGTPPHIQSNARVLLEETRLVLKEAYLTSSYVMRMLHPPEWHALCQKALKYVKQRDPHNLFGLPVDPVYHDLPGYFAVVQKPMDFGTVQRKLNAGMYSSKEKVLSEMMLVLQNCITYHTGRHTEAVCAVAEELKAALSRYWDRITDTKPVKEEPKEDDVAEETRAPSKVSKYKGMECIQLVAKLKKLDTYRIFSQPVDTVALPNYLDVIQHPMDLGTVETKLRQDVYSTVDQFIADLNLIWSNCMTYNKDNPDIRSLGENMQDKCNTYVKNALGSINEEGHNLLESSLHKFAAKPKPAKKASKVEKKRKPSIMPSPTGSASFHTATIPSHIDIPLHTMRTPLSAMERKLLSAYINKEFDQTMYEGVIQRTEDGTLLSPRLSAMDPRRQGSTAQHLQQHALPDLKLERKKQNRIRIQLKAAHKRKRSHKTLIDALQ